MTDPNEETASSATAFWKRPQVQLWFGSAAILATGLIAGGYLLGNGLVRAKDADRSVTVRGVAEREVTADLATWTISYSSTAENLGEAQASVDRDTASIRAFFKVLATREGARATLNVCLNRSP